MKKSIRGVTAPEIDLENNWGWFPDGFEQDLYLIVDGRWHATHPPREYASGPRVKGQVPGFVENTFYFPKEYLT